MFITKLVRVLCAEATDPAAGETGGAAAVTQAKAPTTTVTTTETEDEVDPEKKATWLKGRLEQATKSGETRLLKELGFESADAAKAALGRLKTLDEEKLTAEQRTAAKLAELEPKAQRASKLETTVRSYADQELAGLTEEQKAAVTRLAGEDPATILDTIAALRPTWTAPATTTDKKTETPPPATTTSAGKQPAPTGHEAPVDHKAVYAELKKTNPVAAAEYRFAHPKEMS